jgi:hypothetical protein
MYKAIGLLMAGGLFGAGAMLIILGGAASESDGSNNRSLLESMAEVARGRRDAQVVATVSVAESLELYQSAAARTDLADLQRSLRSAASKDRSIARDIEIDALIARLSDLSPAGAVAVARDLGLATHFVADAFINWAAVDPDAALEELAALQNGISRREIGLALLDVFGDDPTGFNRIAQAFPQSERQLLEIDWLAQRAEFDPLGALRDAQGILGTDMQRRALMRVAAVWAEQDPAGALAQASMLPDPLQSMFRSSVFNEWARLDSAGYLAWIQTVGSPPQEAVVGLRYIGMSDPERMISLVDGMSGSMGDTMRLSALQALAEVDPEAAMARAAAMPPGREKDQMLMMIGMAVARTDPDAALDWLENLSPPSPSAAQQIVISIAQSDPERALDFIDNPPSGIDPMLISSMVVSSVSRNPDQAEILANQLIAKNSIQSQNALRNLVGNWMQQDPESALVWILAHDDQVNAGVLGSAAQSMARSDAVAAASYVDRIPEEYRSAWITQVAGPYGLADPAAALAWVARFQGMDVYDDALRQVISGSAQIDPRGAAELLAQASADVQRGTASRVAQVWAAREPRAAARWAVGLDDDATRNSTIGPVVSTWAASDPSAAKNWTMDLDRGETRDQALTSLISRSASAGDFDRSLLDAFDSDTAQQNALVGAIPMLSRNDPDEARELLDLITSAEMRRQAEENIERMNALR